ncbi:MAG: DUF63 family protein [Archaeoglobaceae archaeon]|nr:DUF63 family protein [Archaeoglobaceae archaeon]MDW7990153.1 DUF63 family protein [Archaeoglobaceae archaeon]
MDIWGFIKKYYIDSIVYKEGYNVVNTITWAVILVLAVFLLYRFLDRRFRIGHKFVLATIPYIILGASARVVEDAGFLQPPISYLFMSPLIFFLIFFIAFSTLIISKRLLGEKYYAPYALIGTSFAVGVSILLFSNLKIVHPLVIPYAMSFALLTTTGYYVISRKTRNILSILVMFSHMLDGFASFIGIQYHGYVEIHVLPGLIVDNFGPIALPVVKFIIVGFILYFIEVGKEKENLKNFIKFVLIVFGFAPALRNGLRITFEV